MSDIPPIEPDDPAPQKASRGPGQGRLAGSRVAPQSPNEALQPEPAPQPPSPPPSRRRPALSAFSGFLSFLLIAAVGALLGLVWSQHRLREPGPLPADKVLYIAPGADPADIIGDLEREQIIDSPFALNIALFVEGNRSKVKAGEYLFKQNASLQDVIDTLVSGKQILHAITIPEGLTSEQIVERLGESDVLIGDVKEVPREGSLLPETYKVYRGFARADLIKKMQDDQKRLVNQIWSRRASDLPLHSPHELVTLASIVEKETGKADERSRVASVFLNRLSKRMRLQSDPTIVYGLVGGKGTLGHGISRAELEKPTPFNTYTIDGLPPGPIANPGRAALEAVANPSRTRDLYFVADGTGGHVFSESLDQHNRNVQRWRQIDREAKERSDKAAAPESEPDRATPDAAAPEPPAPAAPARGQRRGALDRIPEPVPIGATETDRQDVAQATELISGRSQASKRGGGAAEPPPSVYGSLSDSFASGASPPAPPAFPPAFSAIAHVAPEPTRGKPGGAKGERGAPGSTPGAASSPAPSFSAFAMGPGLDELGITVRGVLAAPTETLDGPISDPGSEKRPVETASFPVAPARRAEQKARAGRLGLTGSVDDLPPDPDPEPAAAPAVQAPAPIVRARVIDVSEGTPLDPLRNKTYDLNYPKTVPALK